ncbi:nucleotidyltransferase [Candidatus Peregrinibacteria bacterium RIFCSPLOWO2_01_FULL_39_12]|nr:MAG: nucleotidyltransferase [Candidatus Peregrinibacteria bacterium RIFCSPLOWO2_02_FULL_39_10]OGJ42621.1 MAG: nucleotidyltransferase [Candidatus Peregrinibacteria bacterium RIFCSPLOWO2_01_FULL_39_12]
MAEDIEKILKSQKSFLKEKFRVKKIGIFGSFARNEQSDDSDIDILVEFYEPIGWDFFDLQEYLKNILKKNVDLVTKKALKPQIKTTILNEVKYA